MNNINYETPSSLCNYVFHLSFRKDKVTQEEALACIKVLFNSLRGMSRRHNWFYKVIGVMKAEYDVNILQNSTEVYLILTSMPSKTVKDWIYQYWFKKFGCVECNRLDNPKEFIESMKSKNARTIENARKHKYFDGGFY